jgi:hypothetical protein
MYTITKAVRKECKEEEEEEQEKKYSAEVLENQKL